VQRTGDGQAYIGYSMVGGRVTPCAICTMHKETRRADFTYVRFLYPALCFALVSRAKAYYPRTSVCFPLMCRSSFLFFCEPWCHWPDLVLWFPFHVNDFGVSLMSFRFVSASYPTAGATHHQASLHAVRSFTNRPSLGSRANLLTQ
jgi:hypothetical protein